MQPLRLANNGLLASLGLSRFSPSSTDTESAQDVTLLPGSGLMAGADAVSTDFTGFQDMDSQLPGEGASGFFDRSNMSVSPGMNGAVFGTAASLPGLVGDLGGLVQGMLQTVGNGPNQASGDVQFAADALTDALGGVTQPRQQGGAGQVQQISPAQAQQLLAASQQQGGQQVSPLQVQQQGLGQAQQISPAQAQQLLAARQQGGVQQGVQPSLMRVAMGSAPPLTVDDLTNFILAGSKGGTSGTDVSIDSRFAVQGSRYATAGANEFDAVTAKAYAAQFKGFALGLNVAFTPGANPQAIAQNIAKAQQVKMQPEAELLANVAATYRSDFGHDSMYNNPALRQLLVTWGRTDLAQNPGVGTADVQSIGSVVKALNEEPNAARRKQMLNMIYDFDGNTPVSPSGAVPSVKDYQFAVALVKNGGLDKLVTNYFQGIKTTGSVSDTGIPASQLGVTPQQAALASPGAAAQLAVQQQPQVAPVAQALPSSGAINPQALAGSNAQGMISMQAKMEATQILAPASSGTSFLGNLLNVPNMALSLLSAPVSSAPKTPTAASSLSGLGGLGAVAAPQALAQPVAATGAVPQQLQAVPQQRVQASAPQLTPAQAAANPLLAKQLAAQAQMPAVQQEIARNKIGGVGTGTVGVLQAAPTGIVIGGKAIMGTASVGVSPDANRAINVHDLSTSQRSAIGLSDRDRAILHLWGRQVISRGFQDGGIYFNVLKTEPTRFTAAERSLVSELSTKEEKEFGGINGKELDREFFGLMQRMHPNEPINVTKWFNTPAHFATQPIQIISDVNQLQQQSGLSRFDQGVMRLWGHDALINGGKSDGSILAYTIGNPNSIDNNANAGNKGANVNIDDVAQSLLQDDLTSDGVRDGDSLRFSFGKVLDHIYLGQADATQAMSTANAKQKASLAGRTAKQVSADISTGVKQAMADAANMIKDHPLISAAGIGGIAAASAVCPFFGGLAIGGAGIAAGQKLISGMSKPDDTSSGAVDASSGTPDPTTPPVEPNQPLDMGDIFGG